MLLLLSISLPIGVAGKGVEMQGKSQKADIPNTSEAPVVSLVTRIYGPLKTIISRPTNLSETLECGHTISRPLSLGEFAMEPSKAKRRRCYLCAQQNSLAESSS